ncbi:MAG: PAS domain S-box protein [Bacteroidota bacterium]
MFRSLPTRLAHLLAELAICELSKAGGGVLSASGRSEVAIAADALGVPAALLVPDPDDPGSLLTQAASVGASLPARIACEGALADVLHRETCIDLRPLPLALEESGVRSGVAVRVGTNQRIEGLLVGLAPDERRFDTDARSFLQSAALALHARYALQETRLALEESRARARAVFQTTVDGVITIDEFGRIDGFNEGAERIFEYASDEVVGRKVSVLMPEPYRSEHDGYMNAYRETGQRRIIGIGREVVGRRRSGATFPMDLAVSEVTLPNGERLFTGVIRDLTARRVLEREVLRVAEGERRRIGQDLHDGLGQELTAIGLFLRALARTLDGEASPSATEARRLVGLVDEADGMARTLARSLVPVELEENGLEAALTRLATRAQSLYGLDVHTEATGSGPADADALTADAASNLYRIAQEAVSNAAQHGEADRIVITLVRGEDHLRLRVEDDGVGLGGTLRRGGAIEQDDPPLAPDPSVGAPIRTGDRRPDQRGMGLRIMHYRAHLAGGSLEIRPGLNGGTVVTCTVPLRGPGFLGEADPSVALS